LKCLKLWCYLIRENLKIQAVQAVQVFQHFKHNVINF
jgi:hypothetical protein